jgi:hypothetical protein
MQCSIASRTRFRLAVACAGAAGCCPHYVHYSAVSASPVLTQNCVQLARAFAIYHVPRLAIIFDQVALIDGTQIVDQYQPTFGSISFAIIVIKTLLV